MTNLKLRYLIVAILLAATVSAVSVLQYDSFHDDESSLAAIQTIPMQIGEWQGYDLPLDDEVYEILETRAIIHRNYANKKGETVLLSIVHYADTKLDFHAPEACLGGRGQSITKIEKRLDVFVNKKNITLEVAEILSQNNAQQLLSYYFYKSGDFLGRNYIKLRLMIAKNRLAGRDSSGTLIRISTKLHESKDHASNILLKFLNELLIRADSFW